MQTLTKIIFWIAKCFATVKKFQSNSSIKYKNICGGNHYSIIWLCYLLSKMSLEMRMRLALKRGIGHWDNRQLSILSGRLLEKCFNQKSHQHKHQHHLSLGTKTYWQHGICNLNHVIGHRNLPRCYKIVRSCGHIFHVKMNDVRKTTIYLTMIDKYINNDNHQWMIHDVPQFIRSVQYYNPIYNLGLKKQIWMMNPQKICAKETNQIEYIIINICPSIVCVNNWLSTCNTNLK